MPRPGSFLSRFFGQAVGNAQPSGLLLLAEIKSDEHQPDRYVKALYAKLEAMRGKPGGNPGMAFATTTTVHYAALMMVPPVKDCTGKTVVKARLALETNYDGCLRDHIADLVKNCRPALDDVYDHCVGYPPAGSTRTDESVHNYLYEKAQLTERNPSAYYVALPGRTLEDIRNAIDVYNEAKSFVDTLNRGSDREKVQADLVEYFKTRAKVKPKRFPITQKGLQRRFVLNLAITLLLLPVTISYGIFWAMLCLTARVFEKKEAFEQRKHPLFDPTVHEPEFAYLDLGRQNHICTLATVKPGRFRMFVVRSALFLGRILFKRFYILGKLDQIITVHFARWTLLDGQLMFYGNYDGSWSAYLADFSDQAWGVNLIWSNTIGFPPTRFLAAGGASDLEGFQAQAAEHYSPSPIFYSAYPNYSLTNILRYLEFRDELARAIGT